MAISKLDRRRALCIPEVKSTGVYYHRFQGIMTAAQAVGVHRVRRHFRLAVLQGWRTTRFPRAI